MFSLVITIIAIALVALLALATLYYGGDSFNKSSASSQAAEILSQAQQIQGAISVYQSDHAGSFPDMAALVAGSYLKEIPRHAKSDVAWREIASASGVYWVPSSVEADVCSLINQKVSKVAGIPKKPLASTVVSCFGEGSKYNVILSKPSSDVTTALTTAQTAGTDTSGTAVGSLLPLVATNSTTAGDWTSQPSSSGGSSGGSGNLGNASNGITVVDLGENRPFSELPFEIARGHNSFFQLKFSAAMAGKSYTVPVLVLSSPVPINLLDPNDTSDVYALNAHSSDSIWLTYEGGNTFTLHGTAPSSPNGSGEYVSTVALGGAEYSSGYGNNSYSNPMCTGTPMSLSINNTTVKQTDCVFW